MAQKKTVHKEKKKKELAKKTIDQLMLKLQALEDTESNKLKKIEDELSKEERDLIKHQETLSKKEKELLDKQKKVKEVKNINKKIEEDITKIEVPDILPKPKKTKTTTNKTTKTTVKTTKKKIKLKPKIEIEVEPEIKIKQKATKQKPVETIIEKNKIVEEVSPKIEIKTRKPSKLLKNIIGFTEPKKEAPKPVTEDAKHEPLEHKLPKVKPQKKEEPKQEEELHLKIEPQPKIQPKPQPTKQATQEPKPATVNKPKITAEKTTVTKSKEIKPLGKEQLLDIHRRLLELQKVKDAQKKYEQPSFSVDKRAEIQKSISTQTLPESVKEGKILSDKRELRRRRILRERSLSAIPGEKRMGIFGKIFGPKKGEEKVEPKSETDFEKYISRFNVEKDVELVRKSERRGPIKLTHSGEKRDVTKRPMRDIPQKEEDLYRYSRAHIPKIIKKKVKRELDMEGEPEIVVRRERIYKTEAEKKRLRYRDIIRQRKLQLAKEGLEVTPEQEQMLEDIIIDLEEEANEARNEIVPEKEIIVTKQAKKEADLRQARKKLEMKLKGVDLDKLEQERTVRELSKIEGKEKCPNCHSYTDEVIKCPKCRNSYCSHCAAEVRTIGRITRYKCPFCGKEIHRRTDK